MEGLPLLERQRLGALLDTQDQKTVMAQIPQFSKVDIGPERSAPEKADGALGVMVFNMEYGIRLTEIGEFLRDCPDIRPLDVILANEMDDGVVRSGNRCCAEVLAKELGLNYTWGLEFIELVPEGHRKGHHGNAIFSRWPIRRAGVIRLPEAYNWYFDRQKRIGCRMAVFAELDVGGKPMGAVSIHLENRTDGEGRRKQMETILDAVDRELPGMPVVLGGDLNTNTFDGRDKEAIGRIAADPDLQRACLEDVFKGEPLLPMAEARGYRIEPAVPYVTRRKPLPGGGYLPLRLDWLMTRGVETTDVRLISTAKADCTWAVPGGALATYDGAELSDHNAVWASCRL